MAQPQAKLFIERGRLLGALSSSRVSFVPALDLIEAQKNMVSETEVVAIAVALHRLFQSPSSAQSSWEAEAKRVSIERS